MAKIYRVALVLWQVFKKGEVEITAWKAAKKIGHTNLTLKASGWYARFWKFGS
ncbi:hypothetical protein [Arcticibacter pallidicorallinus]|uniref:hypothetical protein n=1 Tax=Arcticibacter pallidicorallinus TaxID=1259464 RepID=UPI0015E66A13|nr:hypothetical protein [Arcticibacter pallidicorallinus]